MTLHREIYRPQHMYMEFFMKTMTPTHVFHELGGILAQLLTQIGMPGREEQLEKASGVHRFIGHLSCHGHQCHESLFGNLMVTMKYRYFQRILNVSFFTWHIYIYIYIDIHIYNTQKKLEVEFLANFVQFRSRTWAWPKKPPVACMTSSRRPGGLGGQPDPGESHAEWNHGISGELMDFTTKPWGFRYDVCPNFCWYIYIYIGYNVIWMRKIGIWTVT